ncbi:hypothetical protein BS50DRAFT_145130 [Corynespora cassiicola Philippines]|uniref:Uncharacterized protein n=1 Tax=Corynespora cassiicola Philippines TaxID=1448308 RepID=A0A2T2N919_CORCC|nr:hypothetical protein BS50DRAFT_145130 [Corynespora cassiicola Philippines]
MEGRGGAAIPHLAARAASRCRTPLNIVCSTPSVPADNVPELLHGGARRSRWTGRGFRSRLAFSSLFPPRNALKRAKSAMREWVHYALYVCLFQLRGRFFGRFGAGGTKVGGARGSGCEGRTWECGMGEHECIRMSQPEPQTLSDEIFSSSVCSPVSGFSVIMTWAAGHALVPLPSATRFVPAIC